MMLFKCNCKWFVIVGIVVLLSLPARAQDEAAALDIQSFTTDGCSAFPDGIRTQQELWQNCCVAHDRAYWLGGTYGERMAADESLRQCVAALGESTVAMVMLMGVRLGGSPFWPTPYRWGYGWSYPRGYKALTAEELAQSQVVLDADNTR